MADTWAAKASMFAPRYDHGLVAASNGLLNAIGGAGATGFLGSVEAYDPTQNVWTPKAGMPIAAYDFGAAGPDGKIYVIGGCSDAYTFVFAYDPVADSWTPATSMLTGRAGLGAAMASDGGIYTIGGSGASGCNPCATNEKAVVLPNTSAVLLPLVQVPGLPTIQNAGFENGLTGWQTSQPPALPVSIVTNPALAHSGSGAALLGSPSYNSNCSNGGIPTSPAYVAQQVTVPDTSKPTLTFWYHIFTQDWTGPDPHHPIYDSFGVYVNSIDDAHGLFHDGNPSESNAPGCTKSILDLGWKQGSVDLSAHRGQTVTLFFANVNWTNPTWNTYTYLDDVAMTAQ